MVSSSSCSARVRHHVLLLFVAVTSACSAEPALAPGVDNGGTVDASADEGAPGVVAPTFHWDIEPILQQHCQGCHVVGGIGPFALRTYAEVRPMAELMAMRTAERAMPPWGAVASSDCVPPFAWKQDVRLTDAQIGTLRAWSDSGAPEGDPGDAPPPIPLTPPGLAGTQLTLTPSQPFALTATDRDTFRCFVLDPKLTETKYVSGAFVVPGNAEIVHHALVFIDPMGASASRVSDGTGGFDCFGGTGVEGTQLLSAWAPGSTPAEYPPDVGAPLPAGSLLVLQVHYHPHVSGPEGPDATSVQLRFADAAPSFQVISALIGNFRRAPQLQPGPDDPPSGPEFVIPAGSAAHTETMHYTAALPRLGRAFLYSVGAHMHYVGTSETVRLTHTGQSSSTCLLNVPKWDFDWQRSYAYDTPIDNLPVVNSGDTIDVRCTYDNSPSNPKLLGSLRERGISAPVDVRLGESTLDEMCLAPVALLYKAR